MSNQMTVNLGEESMAFLDHAIRYGYYESPDAVLAAAIDLLKERSREIESLNEALHARHAGPVPARKVAV